MIRRYGESVRPGQHYTSRPGAYAILPRGRELLMTWQAEPIPEFQLPGGGVDPGESVLAALHREVMEETGWHIAAPRRLGVWRRFTFMPEYSLWAEKVCHIYLARPTLQISDPVEPGHTAVFVNANLATTLLASGGDAAMLQRFVGG